MTLPLDGVTVVAIEQAVAAPLATPNLADLGARVIKVERIDGGDFARGYHHAVQGTGAHFVWLNRGKESIAVDLKSQEGRAVVRRLVDRADVFLQNLAPGAAERLGFGADELRSRRTELVVVNLSGFGTGGPMEQTGSSITRNCGRATGGGPSASSTPRCRRSYPQRRSATSRRAWVMFRHSASTPTRCSWNRDWTPPPLMTPSPAASPCQPNASNPH